MCEHLPSRSSSPHTSIPMTQLNLRSWFLEPVPHNANRWTKVRVWGIPVTSHTRKWWRSSSIQTRHSANHLQTRYGTTVHLHGPIYRKYATALRMPSHAIRSFARGFPPKWQQLLAQHSTPVRRSSRIAASESESPSVEEPRKSRQQNPNDVSVKPARVTRSGSTTPRPRRSNVSSDRQKIVKPSRSSRTSKSSKPLKTTRSTATRSSKTSKPTTTRSSRITKSTPKTSSKRNKPKTSSENPSRSSKPALKPVRKPMKPALRTSLSSARMSDPNRPAKKPSRKRVAFADFKQTKPNVPVPAPKSTPAKLPPSLSDNWSEVQKEAFERQRNTVPADDPDYWEEIAIGVEGKTAEDCRQLWESSWVSPAAKKTKRRISIPNSPKISTPEVVMHVRKAATKKRSRNTGKYRTGVRRLADMVARETSDELLEPEIVTPKMSGVTLKDGVGNIPALGTDGTPGTEVRQKREKVSQDGELATPEILARGKVFGLQEADRYVSLFKRRLGTCAVPKLKSEHENNKENKHTNVPRSSFIQTTLVPKAEFDSDNESLHSEESDLYF